MNKPLYRPSNKRQEEQTSTPDKYPQGYFKQKPCKHCSVLVQPNSPSHMFCGQPCADTGYTTAYLMRNYGIDSARYTQMLDEQDHRCKICSGEGFVMNKEHHKLKLVVDHCHSTGRVRGLLCHNCNRALGLLKDDVERILKAADYVKV